MVTPIYMQPDCIYISVIKIYLQHTEFKTIIDFLLTNHYYTFAHE